MKHENPLYNREGLPLFDLIKAEHFAPAIQDYLDEAETILKKIEENPEPTWEALKAPFEKINFDAGYTYGVLNHLMSVKNSKALREAYDQVIPKVVDQWLKTMQSKPIYNSSVKLKNSEEFNKLSDAKKRVIEAALIEAKHNGVGLEGKEKERFNQIANRLEELCNKFSNNILDATKAFVLEVIDKQETESWPENLKNIAAQNYAKRNPGKTADPENGPWTITLESPITNPLMMNPTNREHRRQIYHAYKTLASEGEFDNTEIIKEILKLRKEKAQLLGYRNFAELSLETKLAGNKENVEKMIKELEETAKPIAEQEYQQLTDLAKKEGFTEELMPWDIPYWCKRLRETHYNCNFEAIREYFPFSQVLKGLFSTANRLFGLIIKENPSEDIPKWDKEVKFFDVYDENMSLFAHFYLDPYSRPNEKHNGAWMLPCCNRQLVKGELRKPVAHVVCNIAPPIDDKPSLMAFYEIKSLFHEFGHALQFMLTNVGEDCVAAIHGIEADATELVSQFMEYWAVHEKTLMQMSKHYKTSEPLPKELFNKLKAVDNFRSASAMLDHQLFNSKIDLYLHSDYAPDGDEQLFDVYKRILKETSSPPVYEDSKTLCSFSHIFAHPDRAAWYYVYQWSEILSADAFAAFEEAGLDDDKAVRRVGQRFRDTILALGGSVHAAEAYRMFRGRDATTEALLRHKFGTTKGTK